MTARRINVISFIGLVSLLLGGYELINNDVRLILTCALLIIFTSATIIDFLLPRTLSKIGIFSTVLVVVLLFVFGCLTSIIIGFQRHDEYDGGPSFGMAIWPIVLDIIFPVSFSVFIFSLSYLRSKAIQSGILFAWLTATVIYGYIFDDQYTSFTQDPKNAGIHYDSVYFPSETEIVTPLLIGTVLFWTLWISIRWKLEKTSSSQQHT